MECQQREDLLALSEGKYRLSAGEAFATLPATEQQQIDALAGDEIRESDWFRRKGIAYIQAHPLETLQSAGRKIAAGFSWSFNPSREPLVQVVYLFSYGPISILGLLGMVLTWRQWKEHSLIYLLFHRFTPSMRSCVREIRLFSLRVIRLR